MACLNPIAASNPLLAPVSTTTPLSLVDCATAAKRYGYAYCALQDGANGKGKCYGSNDLAVALSTRKTCPNPVAAEGSADTAVLYAIDGATTANTAGFVPADPQNSLSAAAKALSPNPRLLGCYKDTQGGRRAMNLINWVLTPTQCAQKAQQMGYSFYGVQEPRSNGTVQCFGSHTQAEATSQGPAAGQCNSTGGNNYNAVYAL